MYWCHELAALWKRDACNLGVVYHHFMLHQFVTNQVEDSDEAWLEAHCYWVVKVWGNDKGRRIWLWSIELVYLLNMVQVFSIPYFDRTVTAYRDQAARECWVAGLNNVALVRSNHYFERVVFQVKNWKCAVAGHHTYFWVCQVDIAAGYCLVDANFRNQLTEVRTPDLKVALLACT